MAKAGAIICKRDSSLAYRNCTRVTRVTLPLTHHQYIGFEVWHSQFFKIIEPHYFLQTICQQRARASSSELGNYWLDLAIWLVNIFDIVDKPRVILSINHFQTIAAKLILIVAFNFVVMRLWVLVLVFAKQKNK